MTKKLLTIITLAAIAVVAVFTYKALNLSAAVPPNTIGRILLDVGANGEAWYVYPPTQRRYYLGRPDDAFALMRGLGLGATHEFISGRNEFPAHVRGRILLDVETNGEAYYINPVDSRKYYLGRPDDAFALMRAQSLGINAADLARIPVAALGENGAADRPTVTGTILLEVPFASQAPFGGWTDDRQQDGCEEASALMAMRWVRGEGLTKQEALDDIIAISAYQQEKYGEYRDVSAADTAERIFKGYFGYDRVEFRTDIDKSDIIAALVAGKVAVIPMNGRLLGNPNFTAPGPERHMLLVKGYDPETREFITNDPGTRQGEHYRYDEDVFFAAIRDYISGYHAPIEGVKKNMIIVSK